LEPPLALGSTRALHDEDLEYRILCGDARSGSEQSGYWLESPSGEKLFAEDEGALLFQLEKEVTTRIQRLRSDLLFLHAAALGWKGQVILLVGDPGAGKSTLTFGLLQQGLEYFSDELAPIAPDTLSVHPYPRAIWLKRPPPAPHVLPAESFESSRGIHVPCTALGAKAAREPLPVGALFLLEPGVASRRDPALRRISSAEATARLYANILNPRGHPSDGLDAALAVVSAIPCYALAPANLDATRSLVLDTVASSAEG